MKSNSFVICLAIILLILLTGCSSGEQPVQEKKVSPAAAEEPPSPPSVDDASPLITSFVERTGALREFGQFLKQTQSDLSNGTLTVIPKNIEIGQYDGEKNSFPVSAFIVLAVKPPEGEVQELDSGTATIEGYPDIPGRWEVSFIPQKNSKWKVELFK